jgi:hypothetical protein
VFERRADRLRTSLKVCPVVERSVFNPCQVSISIRIRPKLLFLQSTPAQLQSMREKDLESFANTGVKSPLIAMKTIYRPSFDHFDVLK